MSNFYLRDFSMARLQWSVPQVEKSTRLELYGDAGRIAKRLRTRIAEKRQTPTSNHQYTQSTITPME